MQRDYYLYAEYRVAIPMVNRFWVFLVKPACLSSIYKCFVFRKRTY